MDFENPDGPPVSSLFPVSTSSSSPSPPSAAALTSSHSSPPLPWVLRAPPSGMLNPSPLPPSMPALSTQPSLYAPSGSRSFLSPVAFAEKYLHSHSPVHWLTKPHFPLSPSSLALSSSSSSSSPSSSSSSLSSLPLTLSYPSPSSLLLSPHTLPLAEVSKMGSAPSPLTSSSSSSSSSSSWSYSNPSSSSGLPSHPAEGGEEQMMPANTLNLGPLTRAHLKLLLTCEASNNNISLPTSSVVMLDMQLSPRSVRLVTPPLPIVAGSEYDLECEVEGARPPANITWWLGLQRLKDDQQTEYVEEEVLSRSTLRLMAAPRHDGERLECRADHPTSPSPLYHNITLHVIYHPQLNLSFDANSNPDNIREGDDVTMVCDVAANPRASSLTWRHNNLVLKERLGQVNNNENEVRVDTARRGFGIRTGIEEKGRFDLEGSIKMVGRKLLLGNVRRDQAGRYTCHASNAVGDSISNSLRLDVKYSPVCQSDKVAMFKVRRRYSLEIPCHVKANPPTVVFQWTFNVTADSFDLPRGEFSSTDTRSVLSYMPMSTADYGTLLCWASNRAGTQRHPCVFHVVPLGEPPPPSQCTVTSRSLHSLSVSCVVPADDPAPSPAANNPSLAPFFALTPSSRATTFLVTLTPADDGLSPWNVTSAQSSFSVLGLKAGLQYKIRVATFNQYGFSAGLEFNASTLQPTLHPSQDGPLEAEVREETSEEIRNLGALPTTLSPTAAAPPLIVPITVGAAVGLVIVTVIIVTAVLVRRRLIRRPRQGSDPTGSTSSSSSLPPPPPPSKQDSCGSSADDVVPTAVPVLSKLRTSTPSTPSLVTKKNESQHCLPEAAAVLPCKHPPPPPPPPPPPSSDALSASSMDIAVLSSELTVPLVPDAASDLFEKQMTAGRLRSPAMPSAHQHCRRSAAIPPSVFVMRKVNEKQPPARQKNTQEELQEHGAGSFKQSSESRL
ncbi:uncharacterized protein LOC143036161 [Oratosquilla oratoria]|uniref:uncharacterized protein LOC143036161 n=1 Tax=Oratosquilla oratoria TaxID=337810 RepID=UPI003F769805